MKLKYTYFKKINNYVSYMDNNILIKCTTQIHIYKMTNKYNNIKFNKLTMNIQNTKKLLITTFTTLFTILFLSQSLYATTYLNIIEKSISPNPVSPGEDLVVELSISNSESDKGTISSIEYELGNKFTLEETSDKITGEIICGGCSRVYTLYLKANPGVESGTYPITVSINYNGAYSTKEDIFIKILGKPKLIFKSSTTGNIIPGEVFEISLDITNTGLNNAKNIKIIPNHEDIGFLNENFLFIESIDQKANKVITGNLQSKDTLEFGYYQLPLLIEYEDNQNNLYQVQETIGLDFTSKANIILQHINFPAKIKQEEEFELNLRLENDGFGDAKNVNAEITSQTKGQITGQTKGFFGTIKREKDLPHIFNIIPKNYGAQDLTLIVSYSDDLGAHTFTEIISIDVIKSNTTTYVVITLSFLISIGLFIFLKRKHNENKSNY